MKKLKGKDKMLLEQYNNGKILQIDNGKNNKEIKQQNLDENGAEELIRQSY